MESDNFTEHYIIRYLRSHELVHPPPPQPNPFSSRELVGVWAWDYRINALAASIFYCGRFTLCRREWPFLSVVMTRWSMAVYSWLLLIHLELTSWEALKLVWGLHFASAGNVWPHMKTCKPRYGHSLLIPTLNCNTSPRLKTSPIVDNFGLYWKRHMHQMRGIRLYDLFHISLLTSVAWDFYCMYCTLAGQVPGMHGHIIGTWYLLISTCAYHSQYYSHPLVCGNRL